MSKHEELSSLQESPFNRTLVQVLKNVDSVLSKNGNSPFRIGSESISLQNNGMDLATVSSTDIVIAGQTFRDKLTNSISDDNSPNMDNQLLNLLEKIPGDIQLDHLGISYFCGNIEEEKMRIKKIAAHKNIPLQEEPTSESGQTWLFLGDSKTSNNPLFEFVLNEGPHVPEDSWRPHFQIDINTSLSIEEIRRLTDRNLHDGFIQWQLNIPQIGTVLAMGIVGQVNGTKLALGIGTKERNTAFVREESFKSV